MAALIAAVENKSGGKSPQSKEVLTFRRRIEHNMSTVSFGSPDRQPRTRSEKTARFVVACVLIALVAFGVYGTGLVAPTLLNLCIGAGVLVAYLLIAHFVDLEPDYENLGYEVIRDRSGRLPVFGWRYFNNPFQWTDNVSRDFLFWRLLLSPGRFLFDRPDGPVLCQADREPLEDMTHVADSGSIFGDRDVCITLTAARWLPVAPPLWRGRRWRRAVLSQP